jgi:hypothetical protein
MDRKEIEEKFAIGRENVQAIAKQAGELVAAAYEEGFKTCWRIFMNEEFNKAEFGHYSTTTDSYGTIKIKNYGKN